MIARLRKFVSDKIYRRLFILHRFASIIPDKMYLRFKYYVIVGQSIDIEKPISFSEKLQWLKIHDKRPIYTKLVDKYAVKDYVSELIGHEFVIPTYGVWDKFENITFEDLPDQFVLKTTHGGGNFGVYICKDKNQLDIRLLKKKMEGAIKQKAYLRNKEWPYKGVKPRFIAEKYLDDATSTDLIDYKFYCFNGNPKYCQVIRDRNTKETIDFYNMKWEIQDFVGLNPYATNGQLPVPPPINLELMRNICIKLSKNIPFVRVDLYEVNGSVYFGELTFYPASGFGQFYPHEYNTILGNMITLPNEAIV